MSDGRDFRLPRFRRPEYTGENRCLPCTVVNLVFASVLSGAVATVSSPAAAVAVFVLSVALIAVRGYLVPGTPTLTARYLPDRVLARFDSHEPGDVTTEQADAGADGFTVLFRRTRSGRPGVGNCRGPTGPRSTPARWRDCWASRPRTWTSRTPAARSF